MFCMVCVAVRLLHDIGEIFNRMLLIFVPKYYQYYWHKH